jgi:hypothetical protein
MNIPLPAVLAAKVRQLDGALTAAIEPRMAEFQREPPLLWFKPVRSSGTGNEHETARAHTFVVRLRRGQQPLSAIGSDSRVRPRRYAFRSSAAPTRRSNSVRSVFDQTLFGFD